MKTQDNKLKFIKSSLVELDNQKLRDINGGCPSISPTGCICGAVVDKIRTLIE